jgi:hypothetical protein
LRIVFILALIAALGALLYRALRPYLNLVKQFIRTVRHFRNVATPAVRPKAQAEKLVQCGACGIWIPQTRSLMANSIDYCSRDCLQRAGVRRERKAG